MGKKFAFKNDKFKKTRGGYSRLLLISCEKCQAPILAYQKDGPGILKRLYLDRIVTPQLKAVNNLVCKKCKTVLGLQIIYKKENRLAYRLFVGAVSKKILKGDEYKKYF